MVDKIQRGQKAVGLIYSGATWEQVARLMGFSVTHIREAVRESLTEKEYNMVRERAHQNKRRLVLISKSRKFQKRQVASVSETFTLIEMGENAIRTLGENLYVPDFCIEELEKLSEFFREADTTLKAINSNKVNIMMNEDDRSVVDVITMSKRSKKIVALCCKLYKEGYDVQLIINEKGKAIMEYFFFQNITLKVDII